MTVRPDISGLSICYCYLRWWQRRLLFWDQVVGVRGGPFTLMAVACQNIYADSVKIFLAILFLFWRSMPNIEPLLGLTLVPAKLELASQ